MWLFLGFGAIVFAILNVSWTFHRRGKNWYQFASLALTALTLCDFYSDGAARVVRGDWSGLMDTMPVLSGALWICTVASILLNGVSLFRTKGKTEPEE